MVQEVNLRHLFGNHDSVGGLRFGRIDRRVDSSVGWGESKFMVLPLVLPRRETLPRAGELTIVSRNMLHRLSLGDEFFTSLRPSDISGTKLLKKYNCTQRSMLCMPKNDRSIPKTQL